MRFAVWLAVCLAVPAFTFAQPKSQSAPSRDQAQAWTKEPSTVLGLRLGVPPEDGGLPSCQEGVSHPASPCLSTVANPLPGYKPLLTIEGHPFTYAAFSVSVDDSGVLSKITARMNHDRFAEFCNVLKERYGQPTSQVMSEAQSRSGPTYPNQSYVWSGKKITIVASERFESIDQSAVIFSDNAATARASATKEADHKNAASKL
jgi:hypothetical protein